MAEGIRIYKEFLRKHIPDGSAILSARTSDVTNSKTPVALGMRSPQQTLLAVWRIDGPATTKIPWTSGEAKLLYPTDLGIKIAQ